MVRKWNDEATKTPAQIAWEKDMAETRKVWELLSSSQQERFAEAEGRVSRFAECLAYLCVAVRNSKRT
jgi:hypothetical protein